MHARRHALFALPLACLVVAAPTFARADAGTCPGTPPTLAFERVPAGAFVQGSPANEPGRDTDEVAREVTLTHATFVTRSLVTVADFRAFAEATGYRTRAEKGGGGLGWDGKALVQKAEFTWKNPGFAQEPSHPVVLVTADDAAAFAAWLDCTNDRRLRLPSEAELERAARGSETAFSPEWAAKVGVFKGTAPGTRPVGSKPPNALGFVDIVGNASTWTLDMHHTRTSDEAIDPLVVDGGSPKRVVKGGSWYREAKRGRPAARAGVDDVPSAEIGFRLAYVARDPAPDAGIVAPFEPPLTLRRPAEPTHEAAEPPAEESSHLGDVLVGAAVLAGGFWLYRTLRKPPKA